MRGFTLGCEKLSTDRLVRIAGRVGLCVIVSWKGALSEGSGLRGGVLLPSFDAVFWSGIAKFSEEKLLK